MAEGARQQVGLATMLSIVVGSIIGVGIFMLLAIIGAFYATITSIRKGTLPRAA